jgi:hypothetical protein
MDMDIGTHEEKKVNRDQVRCYVILLILIFAIVLQVTRSFWH